MNALMTHTIKQKNLKNEIETGKVDGIDTFDTYDQTEESQE